MPALIDLLQIVEQFQARGLQAGSDENQLDLNAVNAVDQKQMNADDRSLAISSWIAHYKVHRIRGCTAQGLAKIVLAFADSRKAINTKVQSNELKSEFLRLETLFRQNYNLVNEDGNARSVTSLVSKSLWLCYPYCTPIFDRNAINALRVIARLQGRTFANHSNEDYGDFLDAYFPIFSEVEFKIKPDTSYPYKIRVFDKLLWWLGQPSLPGKNDFSLRMVDGAA